MIKYKKGVKILNQLIVEQILLGIVSSVCGQDYDDECCTDIGTDHLIPSLIDDHYTIGVQMWEDNPLGI